MRTLGPAAPAAAIVRHRPLVPSRIHRPSGPAARRRRPGSSPPWMAVRILCFNTSLSFSFERRTAPKNDESMPPKAAAADAGPVRSGRRAPSGGPSGIDGGAATGEGATPGPGRQRRRRKVPAAERADRDGKGGLVASAATAFSFYFGQEDALSRAPKGSLGEQIAKSVRTVETRTSVSANKV